MTKIILLLLYNFTFLNALSNNDWELWNAMEKKFTIDYANDFSNQDLESWLSYFAPNTKININQYDEHATKKSGESKTIKVYSGNILSSIIRGRIPAKLMAKTLFGKLKEQNYQKSNIELLGISKKNDHLLVYARFERINSFGNIYHSARGLYTLKKINTVWYIIEMSTYDDTKITDQLVGFDQMLKKVD